MTSKEIEKKLKTGSRLIIKYNSYFKNDFYIDENIISKSQFDKYKSMCKNKDESENNDYGIKGKIYKHYYWL